MGDNRKGLWAVVGSSVAIFWPGAFIFGFPGVMAPLWKDMFQAGQGALGSIMFFVLAAVGILMFFVGRWQERLGIRAMVSIGALICGLDVILIAFASSLTMVYVWAFVMGAASCFIYIPGLTTVQRWFPARRGLVTGIVNLMFALSAAVLAPILSYLLPVLGYWTTTVILGTVALCVGVVAAQLTGAPPTTSLVSPPKTGSSTAVQLDISHSLTVGQSVRTLSFWSLWFTCSLQGAAGIAMITLSTAYGLSKGYMLESAVIILTAFNLASGLSRLIGGILSDLVGRNLVMSSAFFASGLAYLVLPHVDHIIALAMLAIVIGFAFGTLFAVSAPLTVDCFGILHFGAIFGLVVTGYGFVAGPLGPSLSSYILDATRGNFTVVFSYLGTFCLLSGFLVQLVRPPRLR
ncbi:MAG: MFS transporter [Deltaproteobacteria bacterium]|nr:MFS transporter [Deltaproteobacteria bacterium]